MAQKVSLQPLAIEVHVHTQVRPHVICGGQIGSGTGFSLEFLCFHLSV
jgi:hypothetical protein